MENTSVQSAKSASYDKQWEELKDFIEEHKALLLDYNIATKDMQFKDGKVIYDDVRYKLFDLGWRSMCGRMDPVHLSKRPPADYIRYLPMDLQEKLMAYHFAQCPEKRHFLRCKASDEGPFIRAFLSETYQRGRFDYADFVDVVLNDFRANMPGFRPVVYDVGELIFHVKTLSDVVILDPVQSSLRVGIMFSDSEVGAGSVVIRPFVRQEKKGHDLFILSEAFRRKHSGARRYRDRSGNLVLLDTATLQNGGVSTDKLRITKDIKAHIAQLVQDHQTQVEEAKTLILKYYNTSLPIEDWSAGNLEELFKWVWKRCSAVGLAKGHVEAAVKKLEEYDMPNVWGLFNALCEVAQHPVKEQQLDQEVKASKVAAHLYTILK